MKLPQIENMQSSRGNDVPNQFIIWADGKKIFQSYHSIIAMIENGQVTLDENKWDYSTTTGKYRNDFLGEGINETRKKIKSGEYKLANLNE